VAKSPLTITGVRRVKPCASVKDQFEKAKAEVQKSPDSATAYIELSYAYGVSGMYREAVEAAKQAVKLRPDDGYGHYQLGLYYYYLGRYKEALAACKQAR
jgi:tetratricopeptide (TPR) repeat protein